MSLIPMCRLFSKPVAWILVALLVLEVGPLPVLAAERPRRAATVAADVPATVILMLEQDLAVLTRQGKEAYLDALFSRLDSDVERAKAGIHEWIHKVGAQKAVSQIRALDSHVLRMQLRPLPDSVADAAVTKVLFGFITKAVRQMKEIISKMSKPALENGLKAILRLVKNPHASHFALEGESGSSWWERFFGNSTVVRNFLVTIVTLSAIGVAVGLAIAGSSVAPIIGVLGAVVAIIALLNNQAGLWLRLY